MDLEDVLEGLRRDVSIRDRSYHGRIYQDCFICSEAVDWLISCGHAATREEAVAIGQRLVEGKLLQHVVDQHQFKDAFLFFKLTEDDIRGSDGDDSRETPNLCWKFNAHTMHNSIALSVELADALHAAVASDDDDAKQAAISHIRDKIREESKTESSPDGKAIWIREKEKRINGMAVTTFYR
jgi:hypothetical protein